MLYKDQHFQSLQKREKTSVNHTQSFKTSSLQCSRDFLTNCGELGKLFPFSSNLLPRKRMAYFLFPWYLLCRHLATGYTKQISGREKSSHLWVAYVRTITGRFGSNRCLCQRILAWGMEKRLGRWIRIKKTWWWISLIVERRGKLGGDRQQFSHQLNCFQWEIYSTYMVD